MIVQALQLADGPSAADSVLSLQLSQASHFSCSAHWALVNSLLRRLLHGFASDFMVSLLIVSCALPVSTSFGSSGHFLHPLIYLLNGKCFYWGANWLTVDFDVACCYYNRSFFSFNITFSPAASCREVASSARRIKWINHIFTSVFKQLAYIFLFVWRRFSQSGFKNERGGQSTRKRGCKQQGLGPSISSETVRFKWDIEHWTGLREKFGISAFGKYWV